MKWLAVSVSLVFLAGFASSHAEHPSDISGSDSVDLPEPGTTPVSPLFGLEKAQESISLTLTFNSEKKAEKRLHMAQERLSEAKKLSDDNDSTNAEKAVQMHSKAMERADQAVRNLSEDRRANASKELDNTLNQSISVLEDLKQRLPNSSMKGIETAIEAHQNRGSENRAGDTSRKSDSQNRTTRSGGYKATSRVVRD